MKTLWNKGGDLDAQVAEFTVGDDREIDAHLAVEDVLGSLAHVRTLRRAELLSEEDAEALTGELRALLDEARRGELRPGGQDEDIHSAVERLLTARLGDAGRRVHTARSRNDQVATDVALWIRRQAHATHGEVLAAAEAALRFAEAHARVPLPGMTHLQPAMPSTFGLWALGHAALLLDDALLLRTAHQASDACPLGSAAGYGVPQGLAPLDRESTARDLGFGRAAQPVTAVQGGRGKPEATLLFACAQLSVTCGRLASDVVLYVNPQFGWLRLPEAMTTGSSIMPQKKNPDVAELVRGHTHGVQAALMEVLSLSATLPSGYHRDFQLLKGPLLRGVRAARDVARITAHLFARLEIDAERAAAACSPALYATHRALELVQQGVAFREAYRTVAAEVEHDALPSTITSELPETTEALAQVADRLRTARAWAPAACPMDEETRR